MSESHQNETHERIMDVAESLFMKRGYSAVKLRDIADAVNMKHASLYYYVPKGKEQLFIAVLERSMARHKREMERLIFEAGDDLLDQTYAVSDWLASQPPIDLVRMFESDLKQIDPEKAQRLSSLLLESLTEPFKDAFNKAASKGIVVDNETSMMAAMSLITLIQSVHHIPDLNHVPDGRKVFGRRLADMLLFGLLKR
ncbi:MAG: helix-turn-helix domain-containing protein [Chloroflexota bacterium]